MRKYFWRHFVFFAMLIACAGNYGSDLSSKEKVAGVIGGVLLISALPVIMYYVNQDNQKSKKIIKKYNKVYRRLKRNIVLQMRAHKEKLKLLLIENKGIIEEYMVFKEAVINAKNNKNKLDMIKIGLCFVAAIGIYCLLVASGAGDNNQCFCFNNWQTNEIDFMVLPLKDYELQLYDFVLKVIDEIFVNAFLWEEYEEQFRNDLRFISANTNKYKFNRILIAIVFEEYSKWLQEVSKS